MTVTDKGDPSPPFEREAAPEQGKTVNNNSKAPASDRVSWAEIAKRPGKAQMTAEIKEKTGVGQAALKAAGFQTLAPPQNATLRDQTPMYFGRIKRGPIGAHNRSP